MAVKQLVKSVIQAIYPTAMDLVRARRNRSYFRRKFSGRQKQVAMQLYGAEEPHIFSGPFSGMKYLNETVWGPIEPKWLGTYESQLHSTIYKIINTNYRTVVDVGSAEGYYSVGLARIKPDIEVYSFDVDPWARAQQRRLARLNQSKNVRSGGFCSAESLNNLFKHRSLLICDIEGSEYDLVRPETVPNMSKADLLIELHPSPDAVISVDGGIDLMKERLTSTHNVSVLMESREDRLALGSMVKDKFSSNAMWLESMDEDRQITQAWLWCTSNMSA